MNDRYLFANLDGPHPPIKESSCLLPTRNLLKTKGINGSQVMVLMLFDKHKDERNVVLLRSSWADEFIVFHDISQQAVRDAVAGLLRHGIITRVGRAEYRVNKGYSGWQRGYYLEDK